MLFPERPITFEHVRAFCSRFTEGYRVEYKGTLDANVRDKIPKVISSFANSHGGALVVGIKTQNGVPQPPFQGFRPSPHEEFPLTIESICLHNIYPPLLPQTNVVKSDVKDHVFLVVEVDESAQAPHAIENSRKVYIRTGNAANPYDLAEVDLILELVKRRREPSELRARLLERAKKRFDTHLGIKHSDRGGARTDVGRTTLQFSVGPQLPTRQLCGEEALKPLIQKSWTPWRHAMFPYQGAGILAQHESALVLDAARGTSIFEVNVWGMLFYGAGIWVESDEVPGINLSAFLGYVLLFVRHAASMLQLLGYSGRVAIEISLGPTLRINLLHGWAGYTSTLEGSPLDDEVSIAVPATSEALRERPDSVAAEVFRHCFFSLNCPELVSTKEGIERLVRRAYEYNLWPQPSTLVI